MELIITYEFDLAGFMACEGNTYAQVAQMLGLSKDSIRQMADSQRQIYLREIDGQWHYCEVKPWRRAPRPLGGRGRPRNLKEETPRPKKTKTKTKAKARSRVRSKARTKTRREAIA